MTEAHEEPFRVNYVRDELQLAKVLIDTSSDVAQRLVDSICFALYGPAHEGRRHGYGEIVCVHLFDDYGCFRDFAFPKCYPQFGREAADGRHTFYLSDQRGNKLIVYKGELESELALFDLRNGALRVHGMSVTDDDFWLVVRSSSGVCRVFGTRGIATIRGGGWYVRRYQDAFGAADSLLEAHWATTPFDAAYRLVNGILRIGVHALGETESGATFLLFPEGSDCGAGVLHKFNLERAKLFRDLTLDADADILLAHILRQRDGMTVVVADSLSGPGYGQLRWTGVFLGDAEASKVRSRGGARQLSSEIASTLLPDCAVISVSSDGPVRVWHRGELIASSETGERESQQVEESRGRVGED